MAEEFTHLTDSGVHMVEVGNKPDQKRRAIASGSIFLDENTINLIQNEEIKKGNNDVKRFLKRIAKGKGGEDAEVTYVIDEEKIREEEKYDRFSHLSCTHPFIFVFDFPDHSAHSSDVACTRAGERTYGERAGAR